MKARDSQKHSPAPASPREGVELARPGKSETSTEVQRWLDELVREIHAQGAMSDAEILQWATERGAPILMVNKALRRLDREDVITQRRREDGQMAWEFRLGGRRAQVQYGPPSAAILATMVLKTPCLGKIGLDGHSFTLLRDAEDRPIFTPGEARAMFEKAYRVAGLGAESEITQASIGRIWAEYLGCELPGGQKPIEVIRRPVDVKKKAIGELRHEALPPGTRLRWRLAFPCPPYTPERVILLMRAAATQIGFSPAGNGKDGGCAGLFEWDIAREEPGR